EVMRVIGVAVLVVDPHELPARIAALTLAGVEGDGRRAAGLKVGAELRLVVTEVEGEVAAVHVAGREVVDRGSEDLAEAARRGRAGRLDAGHFMRAPVAAEIVDADARAGARGLQLIAVLVA